MGKIGWSGNNPDYLFLHQYYGFWISYICVSLHLLTIIQIRIYEWVVQFHHCGKCSFFIVLDIIPIFCDIFCLIWSISGFRVNWGSNFTLWNLIPLTRSIWTLFMYWLMYCLITLMIAGVWLSLPEALSLNFEIILDISLSVSGLIKNVSMTVCCI